MLFITSLSPRLRTEKQLMTKRFAIARRHVRDDQVSQASSRTQIVVPKWADVLCGFVEDGGLKNRRLGEMKMSISEVLISATLSVRGEVAERLKAAVC